MKTKTFEDSDKIVYLFSHEDATREVVYHKCCFVFHDEQQVDFDEIAENDLKNWIDYVSANTNV